MNNNLNQDNYLLNQNTQQQYLNIQSYEQQGGETQKIIDFQYTLEFQDPKIRTDFVRKVYVLLALEFFITFLLIALGTFSGMGEWLINIKFSCHVDEIPKCKRIIVPSLLFYISLVISIIIQISLYFGGNTLKKDPLPYLIVIPQLIFFGFIFATICLCIVIQTNQQDGIKFTESYNSLVSIVIIFLIIISQTIYLNLGNSDFSFKVCGIIIICIAILFLIILPFIQNFFLWECFLYSLFSALYTFLLMMETKLMMCRGTLKLESGDYLFGSVLLNALMVQLLVRIIAMIYNATGGRNRN